MNTIVRTMRSIGWLLLFAVGVTAACAQPDPDLAKYAQPPTVESLVTIDGVRIDGSLALSFDLGSLRLGSLADFPFHLDHRLETDYGRATRSVWDIPELYGVIAPAGRDALRWRLFGLGEVIVPAVRPGPKYYPVGMGYLMQRTANGDFSFRNALGWEWVYRDWTLVVGHGPNGLELEFQVQGGRISSMTAERFHIAAGNMEARYDELGRLSRLRIGVRVHEFEYEADSSRLCTWVANAENNPAIVRFTYTSELLSGVQEGSAALKTFGWIDLPEGKQSDCKWPHSVAIGRTERFSLAYDHGTLGYGLSAHPTAAGTVKSVTLNNHKGIAMIKEDGAVVRRLYFGAIRGEPEAGRLTRVEDGAGKVVERYEYDAQGRVVRAWPEGGTCVDFTYDRDGFLVGAAKGSGGDER